MNKEVTFHAHPIYVYKMLKRFIFVLILPVLKGVIQYILYRRISGIILLEGIALGTIIALSVWRLLSFKVVVNDNELIIFDGTLFRKKAVIPRKNLSSITVTRHLALDLVNAATVSINTEAGGYGKKDFTFKMYRNDANTLEDMIYGRPKQIEVRFKAGKIALLSATASSALTGLIVAAPIINRIGKLLNIGIVQVLNDLTTISKQIKLYFPPIVNAITILIIVIYGISFLLSLSRNMFFRISVGDGKTEIKSGLYFKHKRIFDLSAVRDVCIDQTPLMRIFKLYTMRVGIGGYGGENGEKSTVVPGMTKRNIKTAFFHLFPSLADKPHFISCKKDAATRRRFLLLPNVYALIAAAVTALLIIIFPSFERLFLFAALVSLGFISYYGYVSTVNHNICGINIGKTVVVRGVSGFTVRELYVEKDIVGKITLMRTPVDLKKNTCRVSIVVRSESSDRAKARFLPYNECAEKIKETYGINL